MSKQLLIVRHAKSDWDDLGLPDLKRPLNSRGEKNAKEMAKRLVKKKIQPEQLVSSPALRAITTAEYFAKELDVKKSSIIKETGIYEALPQDLLHLINKLDNDADIIALFGHNPSLTHLVRDLSNVDLYNIPTCGMVLIEFPFDDWKMISNGTGELIFYDYPKKEED